MFDGGGTPEPRSRRGSVRMSLPPTVTDPAPADRAAGEPVQRSLPPADRTSPEGPLSVASIALLAHREDQPIGRRHGARADLAYREGRLRAAVERRDLEAERQAASALARALVTRGLELDHALRLARRALVIEEDAALREELAGWFASLGEAAIAAFTLQAGDEGRVEPSAAGLSRRALLLARAGDLSGAIELLDHAAELAPEDPAPHELIGVIATWDASSAGLARAASAYLAAFERRDERGERAPALENLLRAFEVMPEDVLAAERLSAVLASRGRLAAADEVKRQHALAAPQRARHVHLRRMHDAIAEGDWVRALGAGFDAGLDGALDPEAAAWVLEPNVPPGKTPGFDVVLYRLGLLELVAARLELSADVVPDEERARIKLGLGRLYAGLLANPERAYEAFADALLFDPASEAALAALEAHAETTRDPLPLLEALIRVLELSGSSASDGLRRCAATLWRWAEHRTADPQLALWAIEQLHARGSDDPELGPAAQRLRPRAELQHEALLRARAALTASSGSFRVEPLRRLSSLLRGRPQDYDEQLAVVRELANRCPEERSWELQLERLLVRRGEWDELDQLLARREQSALTAHERSRARLALAVLRWRRGDGGSALELLATALDESESVGAAVPAWLLCFAAGLGEQQARGLALVRLSAPLPASLRAMLLGIASEARLAAGQPEEAFELADRACRIDPSLSRPIAERARAALARGRPGEVEPLERAMASVLARAELCRALAAAHELGEAPALSLAWTQRWVALKPGDRSAAAALLDRAATYGDATRIADTLGWLFSQPLPVQDFGPAVARALGRLAELDPSRAAALGRRALDTLGPRLPVLREALLDIAERAGDRGLAVAVLERWAAISADSSQPDSWLALARQRLLAGDRDGAARTLLRALASGAAPEQVEPLAKELGDVHGSDGLISVLELRAALPSPSTAERARLLRELGAARWDLAGDPNAAFEAWRRAAELDPERGLERLVCDLQAFGGFAAVEERLVPLAESQREPARAARLLSAVAAAALQSGQPERARHHARRALDLDLSRADALAVIERVTPPTALDELDAVYQRIAEAALGRYGQRALHYRAARQFERRGELGRALRHAIAAFEAVPAEGVAFVMMARLADRTGETREVIQALELVSSRARDPAARAAWLRRAALFTDDSASGKQQRFEVLLRAAAVRPDVDTVRTLGEALKALVAFTPEDAEILEVRCENALHTLLPRLEGSEGARVAIACASAALGAFGWARLALMALDRAISCDAAVPDYAELVPYSAQFANEPEPARHLVERCVALSAERLVRVSRALLECAAAVAHEFDDGRARTRLLLRAAELEPSDRELMQRAEQAALSGNEPGLLGPLLDSIPVSERVAAYFDMARSAEAAGELPAAIDALDHVLGASGARFDQREEALERLLGLYERSGRAADIERLVERELGVERDPEQHTRWVVTLASTLRRRGDPDQACRVLERELEHEPARSELLTEYLAVAAALSDDERRLEALSRLVEVTEPGPQRVPHLRELAPLLGRLGHGASALQRYRELLEYEPAHGAALDALERDAEGRGDYELLLEVLARRSAATTDRDLVRQLRLRRALLLDQRLGRLDAAREELEQMLAELGDDPSTLSRLAELNERLGALLRAAPLWLRASGLSRDRAEASDWACRSCQAYLKGGDVDAARRVYEGTQAWVESERLIELAVEIERRSESPLGLSQALEELARVSSHPPPARAELLLEAARAALAAGDLRGALAQAQRAARLAPGSSEAQVMAKWLEFRARGPGNAELAQTTLEQLRATAEPEDPAQAELRAFLLAEALEVLEGTEAARQELEHSWGRLGSRPLIALGLAERCARSGDTEAALPHFDQALAGELHELRSRGAVALEAARAARDVGQYERALAYLEISASEAETRDAALALSAALTAQAPPTLEFSLASLAPPSSASVSLAPPREGTEPAPTGAPHGAASDLAAADVAAPPLEPPHDVAAAHPPQRADEGAAQDRAAHDPAAHDPAAHHAPAASLQAIPVLPVIALGPSPAAPPAAASVGEMRAAVVSGGLDGFDTLLLDELAKGSVDAGRALIERLEAQPERSHDRVQVARRLSLLLPGDGWALGKLHQAALSDKNFVYARAIEHVLHAFDPDTPVAAPPILEQPEDPERVRALLFRDLSGPVTEALSLVWEGAEHVFRRDPTTYGITGLERVPLGAPTPLGQTYSIAARALGLVRTPLFQRRSVGNVTISVALLSPPAVLVAGELREESPELTFHLAAMLAAAMPERALLFAGAEPQSRAILEALVLAFGPPRGNRTAVGPALHLAEVLWESIPARSQRRLRELCDRPEQLDYATAMQHARRAVRRAGFFVCGKLSSAVYETCLDEKLPTAPLRDANGLAELCAASPAVADLVRLATSPDYAAVRWQPPRSATRHGGGAW